MTGGAGDQEASPAGADPTGAVGGGLGPQKLAPEEYWTSRLEGDFSLGGVGDRPLGRPFNEWAYRIRRSALSRCLAAHHIRADRSDILEVGFGTGFFVRYWDSRRARSITGLDITARAVEEMSRCFPRYRFLKLDISSPGFPALGAFDIVTVFDVCLHLVDEASFSRAIENVCRQVKQGGYVLLTDLLSETMVLRGLTQFSRPLSAYRKQLEAHGLRVVGLHPIFFTMSQPQDVVRPWKRNLSQGYWRLLSNTLEKAPVTGHVLGPACWAADWVAQRLMTHGPSVKLLVARREG